MPIFDLQWVRAQFPALAMEVNGLPAVFFDGPGGTQVPHAVPQAMVDYLTHANANLHGAFVTSQRTEAVVATARQAIADLLGCAPDEVVFGSNMTTLTWAMSRVIGRVLHPGDEVVVTCLDHDANVAPWLALKEQGVVVRTVDIHPHNCTLDMGNLKQQLTDRTRLVAIAYASNAVGTVNPIAEVVQLAHTVGAWVFVDAVHYAPHGPIDVRSLDCDFLLCSAYKFFGPHVGILYGKRALLAQLQPFKVRPSPDTVPDRWETGTLNFEGLAGLGATIQYLTELGQRVSPAASTRRQALVAAMGTIQEYERSLSLALIPNLLQIPGMQVYGITDPGEFGWRTPTIGLRLAGYTPLELATALGKQGIFTWNGNFYALNLTQRLGLESGGGLVRIGLAHYNTTAEIERLLQNLHELVC
ncbi:MULTISPECIES: cysteine desulfurase-like protein [unclassified Leptolyngbya]|uniref:cysteine desulfurase-like protein n=1 Tax=unclassified Leptolyngbya TaxID=2650499 RepID=UPI001682ACE9|nr:MULTISPECIES: cysteine desulfurase-like protein [unclassified Leptolyngbya]MBD1909106.1 cysteine desulfurase-like protein [Leptolyngbya sp. FACHB-8]MBD2158563.1 cysteine desulfurase-like protein [Leptolyngbya sp. FACHB-16]